ncbi:MAG: hypothetical protein EOO43_03420 [Flavobacterium sp.]|nr:MAG: hypothetical protein EOO43_03420 [Flavobacterium sp.]
MTIVDNSYRWNMVLIFLLVICSLNAFFAKIVMSTGLKSACFAIVFGAICLSVPHFFKQRRGFVLPVQLITLGIFLSIFVSYYSWNQSLANGASTIPMLLWIFFFYLLHIKFPIAHLERIVFFYGWIYIILYIFQFTNSSQVYFGFREEFKEDRGVIRILFPGAGVFFLGYFIALNKVMEKTKYRWLFILFILAGIAVTILQVTKQSIALLLLITIYHLLRKVSIAKKIGVLITSVAIVMVTLNSDNPLSKGIIESQKDNVSDGSDNIRVMASEYFISDFSPNMISRILGNGFPNLTSNYGKYVTMLEDNYGYYLTDVGVIGMYAMFGIIPLLAYLAIFVRGLLMSVPSEFQYLKYYMFLILATSLTSDSIFSVSFLITNVFVLYIYQVLYEQNNAIKQHQLVNIAT